MRFELDDKEVVRILDSGDQSEKVMSGVQTVLSRRLVEALKAHGLALTKAAEASDKYASRLVAATWALVFATIVLAIAALKTFR